MSYMCGNAMQILRECFGESTVFLVDTSPNVTDAFLVAAGNVMMEFVTTASRTTAGSIAVMAYGAARSYSGQAQMIFNNEPKTSKGKRLLRKSIKSIARRPSISDAPDLSSAIRLTDQLQSKSQIWHDIIVMNPNGIRYITPSGHTYQNLELPFPSSSQASPCSIESSIKSSRDCLAHLRGSLFTHYLWKPRSIFEDIVMLPTQDLLLHDASCPMAQTNPNMCWISEQQHQCFIHLVVPQCEDSQTARSEVEAFPERWPELHPDFAHQVKLSAADREL